MGQKNLPAHWCVKKLGEVAKSSKGKMPKALADKKSDKYSVPYVNIKAFEKKIFDQYTDGEKCTLCDIDDVLLVWDGARAGLSGRGIKGAVGSTLARIDSEVSDKGYLYYFLQTKYRQVNTNPRGVGIPHIEPTLLWNFDYPIPPLPEQKRIVAKIEELFSDLDKAVEALKKAQAQLKTYRQAVLKYAFEGRLTHKNIKPGQLPEGWKWVTFGDILDDISYGTSKKCSYAKKGSPVLRIPNIIAGIIDDEDLKYAEFTAEEKKQYSLEDGDILIIRSNGSVSIVGKNALVSKKHTGYLFAGYLIRMRFAATMYPEYVSAYLDSTIARTKIESVAKSTSGVNNINSKEISRLRIPITDYDQQKRVLQEIETRLSEADYMEKTIIQSIEKADATRQSILKKAFEGRLV